MLKLKVAPIYRCLSLQDNKKHALSWSCLKNIHLYPQKYDVKK